MPYLKPVLVTWAALGLHLVEPFYARTIQTGATHSSLMAFFKSVYRSMTKPVDASFFELEEPKLCLGARKETLLGSDSVSFCEDSSLGAGLLLPKSGTSAMYWPGVSWLMQPLYVVLKWP